MTRDGLVMLGVAFLAGVAVGVEYMNYAGAAADGQASGEPLIDNALASGETGSLLPAPMPAEAVTVEPRFRPMLIPVDCVRLDGIENMGREWLKQWGDGDLPPLLPTCVNARHYWQGVYL